MPTTFMSGVMNAILKPNYSNKYCEYGGTSNSFFFFFRGNYEKDLYSRVEVGRNLQFLQFLTNYRYLWQNFFNVHFNSRICTTKVLPKVPQVYFRIDVIQHSEWTVVEYDGFNLQSGGHQIKKKKESVQLRIKITNYPNTKY